MTTRLISDAEIQHSHAKQIISQYRVVRDVEMILCEMFDYVVIIILAVHFFCLFSKLTWTFIWWSTL